MRFQTKAYASAISILAISNPLPSQGELIHRYSFNDTAGGAPATTGITDSVGGANGVVIGDGATFTGTAINLPGGAGGTSFAAFVDLPNGILSANPTVTIEAWYTLESATNSWQRVWDFGSTEGGENNGQNIGALQGQDYFMHAPMRGGNVNQQRTAVRNLDAVTLGAGIAAVNGAEIDNDFNLVSTLNTQYHVATVWEDDNAGGGTMTTYRNGVLVSGPIATNYNASDMNDVNNWLGRSNWTGDGYFDGNIDEFRIYDEALNGSQIAASRTAGPDTPVDLTDDPDNDGIPSAYEDLYDFLDPNDANDAGLDEDSDGLTNLEEFEAGTILDDDDSDDDGLKDGEEINTHSTNPLEPDSDGDGANDAVEVTDTTSDPNIADTDGDGINDGPELKEGLLPRDAAASSPTMIHRYTFDDPAGPAAAGSKVVDLIGGANGIVVGSGGNWTGGTLAIPGGDGATADAAYVDLPNGLLSPLDHTTFEVWYTLRSTSNWGRLWDFGSSEGGEITTTLTGATQGQDYYICSASLGTNLGSQRHAIKNLDALAPGGGTGPVDGDEEAFDFANANNLDQEYHLVGVWTSDLNGGGQLTVYRDGVKQGSRTTTLTPRDINDINNWLGRSNWTADSYLHGDYNEFRIYRGAMNDAAVSDSFAAGPDVGPGEAALEITDITHNKNDDTFTLTFSTLPGRFYYVFSSTDLVDFSNEVEDLRSTGPETTAGPFANPAPGSTKIFFRVTEE